jgi:hypothetical protein
MKAGTMVILGAALIALLLIAGMLFLSESSFSPANPFWDGSSSLMAANTQLLYRFDRLPPGDSGSTLLIDGPSVNYTADDATRVRTFLEEGGRVVVLDDFGTADSLLHRIGSPIAILSIALCQDLNFYKDPSFPVVRGIGNSSLTVNVSELVFNHPVPLQVTDDAGVLARTTTMSWLDFDDNDIFNGKERFNSYPLVARAAYGAGELFVAGDADLVINAMQGIGDDGVLTNNILQSDTVYLDVGHGQQVPPLAWLYYTIKYNLMAQMLFLLFLLLAGCAYVAYGRLFRRRVPGEPRADSRGALIASMKARLPLSDREIEEIKKKL